MSEEDRIKKDSEQIKKEVRLWSYAAWTLPFIALSGLFFFEIIGWENAYSKSLVIGATAMFSIGVFWWWWAIYKIFNFAEMMTKTAERLETIKKELGKFKDGLR